MLVSGQMDGCSTNALVHLFVLAQYPNGNPPAQALDKAFISQLVSFVEAASKRPELLKKEYKSPQKIVEMFWVEHEASIGELKREHEGEPQPQSQPEPEPEPVPQDNGDESKPQFEPGPESQPDLQDNVAMEDESKASEPTGAQGAPTVLTRDELTRLARKVHAANAHLSNEAVNPTEISADSEFLAYLLPEQIPEQIQERKSLAELHLTTQSQPVSRLLSGAHKTLRTEHYKLSLIEGKLGIIHNRIEELRNNDRWSLRQRTRFVDPPCEKTQTDYMLEEMQWMRTNFHQERKFNIAVAYTLAQEAREFVQQRQKTRELQELVGQESQETKPVGQESRPAPPPRTSLVPKQDGHLPLIAGEDTLDQFSQLVYSNLKDLACMTWNDSKILRDKLPYVPVSKFLVPPEDIETWQRVVIENPREIPELLMTTGDQNAANARLFNRHSQQSTASEVRAPKPPDARYINYRLVTIWLPQDDQMLVSLASKLGYNWDLVSSYLMPGMQHTADIERRTPWQCFERWLQLNPNFEIKDLKGRYAEQARIWLDSSSKTQLAVKRRIAPVGVSADNLQRGHKRLRWSSMFDAIRKVKRKRESQPKGNPMRRQAAIEGAQAQGAPARGTPTASELSRIKFERDRAVAEAYAQEQRTQSQGSRTAASHAANAAANARPSVEGLKQQTAAARAAGTSSAGSGPPTSAAAPAPTVPTPTTTIAGLPVPSSVAAAAAANAANAAGAGGAQFTQEQLQQYLSERRRKLPGQLGQVGGQAGAQAGRGGGQVGSQVGGETPVKASPVNGASAGYNSNYYGSPQLQKAAAAAYTGSPHGSPAQRPASLGSGSGPPGSAPQQQQQQQRRTPTLSREQAAALMAKIAQKHPNLTREQVQQLATQEIQMYLQKRSAAQAAQAARNAQAQAQTQAAQAGSQAHSRAGTPLQTNPNSNMGSPASKSFMH